MTREERRTRTAARKAAGADQHYPEHAGAAKATPPARALPVATPCAHVGPESGPKGWHYCEHPDTPLGDIVCACKGCGVRCAGYAAKPPAPVHPNIVAADLFARLIPAYPQGVYSGRGVVVVGGGTYWPSAYVTVRMLRHVGCTLPVQVWFLGDKERDDRVAGLLAPFGVEAIDMLAHPAASACRSLTGFPGSAPFESKTFAVLHSPFEEVLLLDADNYPCADPTVLFEEVRYQRTGGIYWPDGAHTEAWTRWEQWGVPKFGPLCGWEVGQYLIHKRTAWRQLNLARWYDDHGDWCYGAAEHHDHGDKGPQRVAWAYFRTEPAIFNTQVRWEQVAFVQPGPDGVTPMFIHRCRDKLRLTNTAFASTPQTTFCKRYGLPMEREAFGYLEELREALG